MVPGFLSIFEIGLSGLLSLAELRRATSGFETVFLAFLHTRVAGEETSLLQHGAQVLAVILQQGAGHAVADSAGLAVTPPPDTRQTMSNFSSVPVRARGWRTIYFRVSRPK